MESKDGVKKLIKRLTPSISLYNLRFPKVLALLNIEKLISSIYI